MKYYVVFVVQLLYIPTSYTFFTAPLKQIKRIKKVIFVEDASSKKFILKYPRSPHHAINDTLGAEVGKAIGVAINDVKIFPPYDPSISSVDIFPDQIKTLHTLVPGDEVRKVGNAIVMYFTLKSGLANKGNFDSLMQHKDLYKITALDLFLNNTDRTNSNLFYDKDSDHFYAIDMDSIFHRTDLLATRACNFIQRFSQQKLSRHQKIILKNLHKILNDLIVLYPPEKLCNLRQKIAQEAHHQYSQSEQETFRALVERNFNEILRLQRRLARLID